MVIFITCFIYNHSISCISTNKNFIISFEKGTLNNLVFNGVRNYQIVLSDPKFHKAILNTTLYSFTVVPIGLIISMIISLIIFEKIKYKDIFETIFYTLFNKYYSSRYSI